MFAEIGEKKMDNYKIGIIDEDEADVQSIERTILENVPDSIKEEQVSFWHSDLLSNTARLSDEIFSQVIEKIENNDIQILIVDYKIIVNSTLIEGTDIFRRVEELVPKFPLILLSNLPKDCYSKDFVDADKVYTKREFFKLEENYAKEKTEIMFRNMRNYVARRDNLSAKLSVCLTNLEKNGYCEQTLKDIIETENMLDCFCPQQQSIVEKQLDIDELKSAVDLITKAKKLLGGDDEN